MFKLLLLLGVTVQCLGGPTAPLEPAPGPAAGAAAAVQEPQPPQQLDTAQPAAVVASGIPVVDVKEPMSEGPRAARSYDGRENEVSSSGSEFEDNLMSKLNSKCAQRDPSSCAMLKLVTYMNRLLKKANIQVADNVQVVSSTSFVTVHASELPRSLSNEPEETQLTELLTNKLMTLVRSRALRLRLLPTTDLVIKSEPDAQGNLNLGMAVETVPATESGRGKNKNMGGLLAAVVMKMGMLGALAFKGLALLVGKALLVSKIALLLAVVLGLKKLFSQQKHVTYEVVAQPHHSHAHVEHVEHGHGGSSGGGHDSYSSGWSRSLGVAPVGKGDGQALAYGSYSPQ